MQDLTAVGLSKDGSKLLLVSPSGEDFAVPVDKRLRAALRGDNARLGQLEMKMESALRPRDIQARIRAGESPEDVAAAAQTTVEMIMGFATPVLAERAHVAQTAQRSSLRRRSGESGSARTLGEAAEIYFAEHSLHEDDVSWDSWRRPDGRWALVAEYVIDGRPRRAEFTHDMPGRYVVADNDEAKVLTGEVRPSEAPAAGRRGAERSGRRLSAVPADDELPLGDDAIELVRDRGESPAAAVEPDAVTADADWISTVDAPAPEAPGTEVTPDPDASDAESDPDAVEDEPDPDAVEDEPTAEADRTEAEPSSAASSAASTDTSSDTEDDATRSRREGKSRRKGRASVPTWDEIMFGGGKGE
ncbi:MAG TPA: septation protein SepH [Marmoricola sp.]|nr:septation protein SepH [Marmoricola sp.]